MPIDLNDSGLEAEFTFERDTTGVIDEPPFHILALGDWSCDAEKNGVANRKPIEIDRDNFDEIIARLNARVNLEFDDGSYLALDFFSLDHFHPDEIFRRVSAFEQLRDLRRRLKSSDGFNAAAREARELFGDTRTEAPAAPAEPSEEPADNLLDAILSKPSGGAPPPKPGVSSELSGLVSDLVRPHLISVDEDEQASLIAAVDSATSGLMRKILHHRKFQTLEAAWRGLFFMVRRADTSSDLKIFLLNASKQELADELKSAESLASTSLYKILVRDAIETPGADPWSLICADYAYEPTVDDVASLIRISKLAAGAGAPFVSHMRPDILGVHSLAEHPDQAGWKTDSASNEAKLWSALRAQVESKYLGMAIPRFITRLPYGADTDPLETFSFEEFPDGPEHDLYNWANGCFLVTMLFAQSYAAYGWEMGQRLIQDADGLPVHVYEVGGETVFKPCAEIPMTDVGANKLMEYGLMPLVSYRATDRIKLARFQSIADPVTGLKGRWS